MPGRPHLMLFDAMNLLRRYFAVHPQQDQAAAEKAGEQALQLMLNLLNSQSATHTAAVFDGSGQNWRKYHYPEYKSARPTMPDALASALEFIQEQWWQQGIDSVIPERDEADDVIATLASKAVTHNVAVTIVSSDRGYAPLIDNGVKHWHPFSRCYLDADYYRQKYQITPSQWPAFKALIGDTSSSIPGVPGFGKKTASQYLNAHADPQFLPEKKQQALHEHQQQYQLMKKLVTLRTDCPLGFNLRALRWHANANT